MVAAAMTKTNTAKGDQRDEAFRTSMKVWMAKYDRTAKDIANVFAVTVKTVYNRFHEPGKMSLEDFRLYADMMALTDEEIVAAVRTRRR